jgi:hypothetical protein
MMKYFIIHRSDGGLTKHDLDTIIPSSGKCMRLLVGSDSKGKLKMGACPEWH